VRAGKQGELQGWRPALAEPNIPRPPEGVPQDIADHMRLMCDILVLGFQTDTTRITTLKLNNDHSSLRFPHLGVDYMIHHLLSHSDTADWLKVNQFFTQQVAYIAAKLDKIQEGERTALDNSMILFASSMLQGSTHECGQLPVVLVGRGGGKIQTGRALDYLGKPNRAMCSLYLSMLDKMGVHLDSFGDSKERLAEI
jgi:ribonucleotide monophosphatase NagD (HAD superfamily)